MLAKDKNRQIILGRNSKIWANLERNPETSKGNFIAIGHRDLPDFTFLKTDTVWVFSYSKSAHENKQLLQKLGQSDISRIVYISSASTNVVSHTHCYRYPTAKYLAEKDASDLCDAKIVKIGVFYSTENELPKGQTVATSADELIDFMLHPSWNENNQATNLFRIVDTPFQSKTEQALFQIYGFLMRLCKSYPCLLRPFDIVLRALNMRWYGYLYLSNKLWSTTTS